MFRKKDPQRWFACEEKARRRWNNLTPAEQKEQQWEFVFPAWYLHAQRLYDQEWGKN